LLPDGLGKPLWHRLQRQNEVGLIPYAQLPHQPAIEYKNITGRADRELGFETVRLRILSRRDKPPFTIKKQHIERDQGVLHPETSLPVVLEKEQHACGSWQACYMHQPIGLLLRCAGQFNFECENGAVAAIKADGGLLKIRPVSGAPCPDRAKRQQQHAGNAGEQANRIAAVRKRRGNQ